MAFAFGVIWEERLCILLYYLRVYYYNGNQRLGLDNTWAVAIDILPIAFDAQKMEALRATPTTSRAELYRCRSRARVPLEDQRELDAAV